MHWAGWERLVNWQTFLAADVNVLSQNTLNMMLRTKIWTPWTMWELICLDEGGPQLDDLEVKIITPEVEIPQAWSKESPRKVRGGPGFLCCQTLEAILAKWLAHGPTDHKGTFQTFYPPTVTSWWVYRGQMSSSQPVWQKGGVRDRTRDLLISLFFPTSRLAVVWTLVNHSVWVPVKLIHLKAARSLFRLWCWTRKNNFRPCRACSL